jgi:cyclohexanone monooxygenase
LIDIRSKPLKEITPTGLRTTDADYALDAIVFATGFDAMTGAMKEIDIHTDAGMSVREKWEPGPRTYLGITIAGFPNLFMITGPQSPGVKSQMILACEQHVDWIADCTQYLLDHGFSRIEAQEDAEDAWIRHNNEVADRTLYPLANSWYVGANIPGKPHVFMPYVGGVAAYKKKCDDIALRGYEGFRLGLCTEDQRFAGD